MHRIMCQNDLMYTDQQILRALATATKQHGRSYVLSALTGAGISPRSAYDLVRGKYKHKFRDLMRNALVNALKPELEAARAS